MVNPLIGIHLAIGEIAILSFIWVIVELINPDIERIRRAKIAALVGVIFFFLSWITGGYYYLTEYGSVVKPMINAGASPWAHKIVMEVKEHVFLMLPFLAVLVYGIISNKSKEILQNKNFRRWTLYLSTLVVFLGMLMAFMGYLISSAARDALAAGVVV
jgi:magnesium-transporting ATPase (P-type)